MTCFVLGEGDDVLVVVVDEPGEGARLAHAHAHLVVVPAPRVPVLLQAHQAPAQGYGTVSWQHTSWIRCRWGEGSDPSLTMWELLKGVKCNPFQPDICTAESLGLDALCFSDKE